MVAYEPDERPSIDQILNDAWFGSIRGMKDDQLIEYVGKEILENLTPNFTDGTAAVPGGDGTYYWRLKAVD